MPFKIAIGASFMSDLVKAPRDIQNKYKEIFSDLEIAPDLSSGKKKKLTGCKYWRYRVTPPEYRVIYRVDKQTETVELIMMGPRKDDAIYKRINYVPEKGPTIIPYEVLPDIEPEFAIEHNEIIGVSAPPPKARKLPAITQGQLRDWKIDEKFWATILESETEDGLLNAEIPQHVKLRVIDCLWPKPIEQVAIQPTYIVKSEEDLAKVADGKMSRLLLNLDNEQLRAVDPSVRWPIIVKGGPGSGKTVVALYKISRILNPEQADIFPKKEPKILFTTYTKSLKNSAEELLRCCLGDKYSSVTIETVAKMAKRFAGQSHDPADNKQGRIALTSASNRSGSEEIKGLLSALGEDYILKEFAWVIEGWGLKSEDEYLKQDRTGRKRGLSDKQRKLIWKLFILFKDELKKRGLTTWEQLQNQALRLVRSDRSKTFDFVFVDEVQDLKPVGLQFCVALCADKTQVYLTADMNQSIYGGGGVSWKSVDTSLRFTRSSSTTLNRNYRCTDQILRAASDIISDLADKDAETLQLTSAHLGPKPIFMRCETNEDQNMALIDWIRAQLRYLSLPLSCAGIFCTTNEEKDAFVKMLNIKGLPSMPYTDGGEMDIPKVKVMTIHSSKGLEFPVVAMPNFEVKANNWLGDGDPDAALEMARRLFYVGCTRALRRLMLTCVGQKSDPLQESLTEENWEIK
jgi:superfamily I DNA/RNA helicase/mRNA-degrading endonuclease RelE of RelBE toxin-antitoxin system